MATEPYQDENGRWHMSDPWTVEDQLEYGRFWSEKLGVRPGWIADCTPEQFLEAQARLTGLGVESAPASVKSAHLS